MYSIYSYPVDASCSSHYARDNIKSYIFFCALSSMETIVVSTGWLVFISIFNYFVPTWNKDNDDNSNNNINNNNNNNDKNNNNKKQVSTLRKVSIIHQFNNHKYV